MKPGKDFVSSQMLCALSSILMCICLSLFSFQQREIQVFSTIRKQCSYENFGEPKLCKMKEQLPLTYMEKICSVLRAKK